MHPILNIQILGQHLHTLICVLSFIYHDMLQIDLRRGLYSIFVTDWMKVYPSEQMLILRFEDYKNKVEEHLQQVFTFLDLSENLFI